MKSGTCFRCFKPRPEGIIEKLTFSSDGRFVAASDNRGLARTSTLGGCHRCPLRRPGMPGSIRIRMLRGIQ